MGYDDVIPLLGNLGKYQKRICFLICLPSILCAFHQLSNIFLQAKPEHRCQLEKELPNATFNLPGSVLNKSYPYDPINQQYSSCSLLQNGTEVACISFIYGNSKYSVAMEWDLVCDKSFFTAMGDSIFMSGVLAGSIIFSNLSDMYGRKLTLFVSLVIEIVFGLLLSIAPTFWSYVVIRFIVGSTTAGTFLTAYVIAMEMVNPENRMVAGVICQMFYSVGYMLTTLFAYLSNNWRTLQVVLTLPGVFFISYWWLIPESTRWLLTKGRLEEAKLLIRKAAIVNKLTIDHDQIHFLLTDEQKSKDTEDSVNVLEIFKYPNLRKRSLIVLFDWMVNSMSYYGLSWNTSNLGGNVYINFVISGAVEIPAYIFLLLTLNRWGRKFIMCGCMFVAGAALLLTMAVPEDNFGLVVLLAMIGKLAITASYSVVYIFSTEQFPTVIRNAALGAGYACAMIGTMMAPFINLLGDVWKPSPLIVFGALALCAGSISLILPETLNQKLPETIADAEFFGCDLKITARAEDSLKIKLNSDFNK